MLNPLINSTNQNQVDNSMSGLCMCMPNGGVNACEGQLRKKPVYVNICRESACPITVFSLLFMLHRNGVWMPEHMPETISGRDLLAAFKSEVLEPGKLTCDDEVWPLVESLEVDREKADQTTRARFQGYIFSWNYNVDAFKNFKGAFIPKRQFCVEPALALGIMARLHEGFYQSDRIPDYSIGNLCLVGAAFSAPRLSGEPMYPLWNKEQAKMA